MGVGIAGNNVCFSVSGAVAASGTGNATLYTCPSDSYAIIQYYSGGTGSLSVGGQQVFTAAADYRGIYVGPGQAVALIGASGTHRISGVEFTNS